MQNPQNIMDVASPVFFAVLRVLECNGFILLHARVAPPPDDRQKLHLHGDIEGFRVETN